MRVLMWQFGDQKLGPVTERSVLRFTRLFAFLANPYRDSFHVCHRVKNGNAHIRDRSFPVLQKASGMDTSDALLPTNATNSGSALGCGPGFCFVRSRVRAVCSEESRDRKRKTTHAIRQQSPRRPKTLPCERPDHIICAVRARRSARLALTASDHNELFGRTASLSCAACCRNR